MDKAETEFLKTQERTPLLWLRCIDDMFFIWTHSKQYLEIFLLEFNLDLKFTYGPNGKEIPFLDLNVKLNEGTISAGLHIKSTDRYQYLHFTSSNPT